MCRSFFWISPGVSPKNPCRAFSRILLLDFLPSFLRVVPKISARFLPMIIAGVPVGITSRGFLSLLPEFLVKLENVPKVSSRICLSNFLG